MSFRNAMVVRIVTLIYCSYILFSASMFQFMALNVFLAYIPIELSFHLKKVKGKLFIGISFFWLLFYPNAPYLLTDFFHLEALSIYQKNNQIFSSSILDWWSFCLLTFGIIVYYFLGVQSIGVVIFEGQKRVEWLKNKYIPILFVIIHFLSSLAIYVGRFERLHSVYLFTQPIQTIKLIFFEWNLNKLLFILMFTFLQSTLMLLFFRMEKTESL